MVARFSLKLDRQHNISSRGQADGVPDESRARWFALMTATLMFTPAVGPLARAAAAAEPRACDLPIPIEPSVAATNEVDDHSSDWIGNTASQAKLQAFWEELKPAGGYLLGAYIDHGRQKLVLVSEPTPKALAALRSSVTGLDAGVPFETYVGCHTKKELDAVADSLRNAAMERDRRRDRLWPGAEKRNSSDLARSIKCKVARDRPPARSSAPSLSRPGESRLARVAAMPRPTMVARITTTYRAALVEVARQGSRSGETLTRRSACRPPGIAARRRGGRAIFTPAPT